MQEPKNKNFNNNFTKEYPHDIVAEKVILCSLLIDAACLENNLLNIKEDFFYDLKHKVIFISILKLFEKNVNIDIHSLLSCLNNDENLEKAGGLSYLAELIEVVISSANFEYFYELLKNKAILRNMIKTCNSIVEDCYSSEKEVSQIIDEAEQNVLNVSTCSDILGFTHINNSFKDLSENLEEMLKNEGLQHGTKTGFKKLDEKLGALKPGQLIILAARPSMGKTSLALNIAYKVACGDYLCKNEAHGKVAILSLEMSTEEVLTRIISAAAEITMDTMTKGKNLDINKIQRIAQIGEFITNKSLYIDDNGSTNLSEVKSKCRRLKTKLGNLDLIVIDYLQLMILGKKSGSREQEISEISRSLKLLAKELNVPILALSQLNRSSEMREDKRPLLSDLRESGSIEQDADVVMFIYRGKYYRNILNYKAKKEGKEIKQEDNKKWFRFNENEAEILIQKNRNGAQGKIYLSFNDILARFENIQYKIAFENNSDDIGTFDDEANPTTTEINDNL